VGESPVLMAANLRPKRLSRTSAFYSSRTFGYGRLSWHGILIPRDWKHTIKRCGKTICSKRCAHGVISTCLVVALQKIHSGQSRKASYLLG
jgi:hypothetical protein